MSSYLAYEASASVATALTGGFASYDSWKTKQSELVKGFDLFERYLLTNTSSYTSWPRIGNSLLSVEDARNDVNWQWLRTQAEIYDDDNRQQLIRYIPTFVFEDSASESYITFVKMLGQYFDEVKMHIKGLERSKFPS